MAIITNAGKRRLLEEHLVEEAKLAIRKAFKSKNCEPGDIIGFNFVMPNLNDPPETIQIIICLEKKNLA